MDGLLPLAHGIHHGLSQFRRYTGSGRGAGKIEVACLHTIKRWRRRGGMDTGMEDIHRHASREDVLVIESRRVKWLTKEIIHKHKRHTVQLYQQTERGRKRERERMMMLQIYIRVCMCIYEREGGKGETKKKEERGEKFKNTGNE